MPSYLGVGIRVFVDAPVASVLTCNCLLTVQQAVALRHVMYIARRVAHGVHQARLSIDADMRFHPTVPLIALFARMHLGVSGFVFVLC